MKITTKTATEPQKDRIFALYRESMQEYIESIWGWDDDWQINDFKNNWTGCDTRSIEVDARFIGYLQTEEKADSIYVKMIVLEPAQRSKGYGSEVIKKLSANATHRNKKLKLKVFRQNSKAIKFYQKLGFRTIEDTPDWLIMES